MPVILATLILWFPPLILPGNSAEDVIATRKHGMKAAGAAMKLIKESIKTSKFEQARTGAETIQEWANVMLNYFPKGTSAAVDNESDASEEIWQNLELFEKFIDDKKHSTQRIILASKARNKQQLTEAFNLTRKTCIGCHKRFRN